MGKEIAVENGRISYFQGLVITHAQMAYLGSHKCKGIDAGVEIANGNADGEQAQTCRMDTE